VQGQGVDTRPPDYLSSVCSGSPVFQRSFNLFPYPINFYPDVIYRVGQKMVATHLRCCGIFGDNVITNFLLILTVKDFENRLIFDKVKRFNINCAIFWPTLYKSPLSRPHGYFSKYLGLCNVHGWHYTVTISYAYITLTCYFIKGASFDERCVAPWRPAFYFVCK